MRRSTLLLFAPLLLAAGSAPLAAPAEPADLALARARAEAADADRQVARLEAAAARAGDEASKLRTAQAAAAAAISGAEARISAADVRAKMVGALVAARRERLARQQRPVASLLAGLATMARRPPLLTLADEGSVDEFVRVRALLDTTLPVIRKRTAALSAEIAEGRRLERETHDARREIARGRDELAERQAKFAQLEQRALALSASLSGQSLLVGDVALARGEEAEVLGREEQERRSAASLTAELAALDPAPPRPFKTIGQPAPPPLAYQLPLPAKLIEGLGEVSSSGVRSRGVTLAAPRGASLAAPADGKIVFAGPFRSREGIVIIDHGGGWMTLISNASTPLAVGATVRRGEPLGRALGHISLELSHLGRPVSAALIAGSSQMLSKTAKATRNVHGRVRAGSRQLCRQGR
jgi:septal ring factor EnvC (AmiA/AmiB activator)